MIETSPGSGTDLPVSVRSDLFVESDPSPVVTISYVGWLSTEFIPIAVPAMGFGAALGLAGLIAAVAVRRLKR